jgi:hypothetical protein
MSRSLVQVRVEVETRLGDSTNAVWSDAELNGLIQEGYDELVRTTGILWKRTNPAGLIPTIATGTYTLPTDLELIERLAYQNRRIFPITPEEANVYYGAQYRTIQGTLVAYIMNSDGIGTIRYVRVPAATGAATDVYIEYQVLH